MRRVFQPKKVRLLKRCADRERFLSHNAGPTPSTGLTAHTIAPRVAAAPSIPRRDASSKRLFASGSRCEMPRLLGLDHIKVTLTGTNDLGQVVSLSTVTDANGGYAITGLFPGVYRVVESAPKNFLPGKCAQVQPAAQPECGVSAKSRCPRHRRERLNLWRRAAAGSQSRRLCLSRRAHLRP